MKHTQTHTYTHAPNSPTAKQQKKLLTPKPFTANIQEPQVLSIKLLFCCHFHILFSYFLLFGFFHFVALAEIYFEVIFFWLHTRTQHAPYTRIKRETHTKTLIEPNENQHPTKENIYLPILTYIYSVFWFTKFYYTQQPSQNFK